MPAVAFAKLSFVLLYSWLTPADRVPMPLYRALPPASSCATPAVSFCIAPRFCSTTALLLSLIHISCIPQTPPVPYGRIPQRESFPPLHGLEAVSGSACDLTSGYCGKFHNHRGCFRWNYFLRLHCAGAAASQPRYESDSLCLRCTGHDLSLIHI